MQIFHKHITKRVDTQTLQSIRKHRFSEWLPSCHLVHVERWQLATCLFTLKGQCQRCVDCIHSRCRRTPKKLCSDGPPRVNTKISRHFNERKPLIVWNHWKEKSGFFKAIRFPVFLSGRRAPSFLFVGGYPKPAVCWPGDRASDAAAVQEFSEDEKDDQSDVEAEERPDVDSDEEINDGSQEVQLEQVDEPPMRLKRKTQPMHDRPEPSYEDYPKDAWPKVWKGKPAPVPGQSTFNAYAAECVDRVLEFWKKNNLLSSMQVYQKTALACSHPLSPCKTLLVDARMGAGKTAVLIEILNQHFLDPRKKLPVFPTKALVGNFLDELLRWPSSYRSYFALMQPEAAARAVPLRGFRPDQLQSALEEHAAGEWRVPATEANDLRQRLRVELEMTSIRKETGEKLCAVNRGRITKTFRRWFEAQFPGKLHLLPGAPLRAMNLSTAGGSFSAKRVPGGEARHPVAQFMYDMSTKNVFDNAVVVIDEARNCLVHVKQCKLLVPQLKTASNLTLVGASPCWCSKLAELVRSSHVPDEMKIVCLIFDVCVFCLSVGWLVPSFFPSFVRSFFVRPFNPSRLRF